MKWEYQALRADKTVIRDIIEADTGELAILKIFQNGLVPMEVWELAPGTRVERIYSQLSHLQDLKAKLEGRSKDRIAKTIVEQPEPRTRDYTYLVFAGIISTMIVLLALAATR